MTGVQIVELNRSRVSANDLSRGRLAVATNTVTETNYLGLTGKGILVNVNDTGVDAQHPVPHFVGCFRQLGAGGYARVVHQDQRVPQGLPHAGDHGVDLLAIADIAAHGLPPATGQADCLDRFSQLLVRPGGHCHVGSGGGQRQRHGPTDSAAAPRNQRDASGQLRHVSDRSGSW